MVEFHMLRRTTRVSLRGGVPSASALFFTAFLGCGRVGVALIPVSDTALDAGLDAGLEAGFDAGDHVGDAEAGPNAEAGPTPTGLRVVVDVAAGGATLRDYPVRVRIDTQQLVAQGLLEPDCSNLRVFGADGCTSPWPYFVAANSCNSANTELWVRAPVLLPGTRETFAVIIDTAGEPSDPARVFSFFDGFDGQALDRARWRVHGDGSVMVVDGELRTQGIAALESIDSAVSAGRSVVGVRIAALGQLDTDVELGAGTIANDAVIWAYGRDWDGVTFLSYDATHAAFNGPAASTCNNLAGGSLPAPIGNPWVDHPPATATFLTAEFGYANRGGRTHAWLRSSRGASFDYEAPAGCTLPDSLPILISLDHVADAASPTQHVDYIYVRSSTANEPTASVSNDASHACGTE